MLTALHLSLLISNGKSMEPAILLLLLIAVTLFSVSKKYDEGSTRLVIQGTALIAALGALTTATLLFLNY